MSRGRKLTTTSYAILGLLAVRSWSSYELTKQMQRSLGRFWPRAASKLYEEPRKLVTRGFATERTEQTGKRLRTVYTITPTGREALADWLGAPSQGPVLESEQMLKVFLADQGTKDDLLRTISAVRDWARERTTADADVARSYLDGSGPFPQRLAHLALVGRFSADFAAMTENWAKWATSTVEQWPDHMDQAPPAWDALEDIAGRHGAHHDHLDEDQSNDPQQPR